MKAPSRISKRLAGVRAKKAKREAAQAAVKERAAKQEAEREEARRRQAPLAFWMKRELTDEDEETNEIDNWRMLVQVPPGVWQRSWDPFQRGTAHYTAQLLENGAHLFVSLPRMREVWWEIKITAWGTTLAIRLGADYPEMMRQCLGEAIERLEGAHDKIMYESRRAALTKVLREGERLVQAWIERYAQKEAEG